MYETQPESTSIADRLISDGRRSSMKTIAVEATRATIERSIDELGLLMNWPGQLLHQL